MMNHEDLSDERLQLKKPIYGGDTKLRGPTRSQLLEPYVQLKKTRCEEKYARASTAFGGRLRLG